MDRPGNIIKHHTNCHHILIEIFLNSDWCMELCVTPTHFRSIRKARQKAQIQKISREKKAKLLIWQKLFVLMNAESRKLIKKLDF